MPNVKIEQDEDGNFILPLGEDLTSELGWDIGDTIMWEDNENGSFTLSKKPKTKIVMVEAVSSYRMRYAVEIPEDAPEEWATDTVTMEDANEFSQKWLGETIISTQVIDQMQFLTQYRADNEYISNWSDDLCFENGLTKWESK